MMNFKKISINDIKRYVNARAMAEFDRFLDELPKNVGYNAIILVAVIWVIAGGVLYFTVKQANYAAELRNNLVAMKSMKPPVPKLEYEPVEKSKLDEVADSGKKIYKDLNISSRGSGQVFITAADTDFFPEFIAAVGYVQRSGRNWKVEIKDLCIGRDCKSNKISAMFVVQVGKVSEKTSDKDKDKADDK